MSSDNNTKLNLFFNRLTRQLRGTDRKEEEYKKLSTLNDTDLKIRYVELKATVVSTQRLIFMLIAIIWVSFFFGILDLFKAILKVFELQYGLSKDTFLLTNELFLLLSLLIGLSLFIILLYYWHIKHQTTKYYYLELLLRERSLI